MKDDLYNRENKFAAQRRRKKTVKNVKVSLDAVSNSLQEIA